jgi:hypothetical protein
MHTEAILVLKPGADRGAVQSWFTGHGFTVNPMQAGILVSGAADLFQTVFLVDLSRATLPLRLSIPRELQDDVTDLEVCKPPTYHMRDA